MTTDPEDDLPTRLREAVGRGAAILGGTLADGPAAPGTGLHHLQALSAEREAGRLTTEELRESMRRWWRAHGLEPETADDPR